MRSNDEFLRLIYEKENKYNTERRKKVKNAKVITTSLAACFVLCLALIYLSILNSGKLQCNTTVYWRGENKEYGSDQMNEGIPFDVNSSSVSDEESTASDSGSRVYERYYINPDKIKIITEYISNLTLTEADIDEAAASNGIKYTVTVKYDDKTAHTYYISSEKYLKIDDGKWQKMSESEAIELRSLLFSIKSDKEE